jgi:polyhydroxybutyrate depolymerase
MTATARRSPGLLRAYWIAAGLLMLAAAVAIASLLHWGETIEAADARYAELPRAGHCAVSGTDGRAGRHRLRSAQGVPYIVVTPRNYDATRAHPLLVVYAPATFTAGLSERFAGLTREATTRGFVLAYVSSVPRLRMETLRALAKIPAEVGAHWCIDPDRVYAGGHSDGGTVALALGALDEFRGSVDAIVASGAGWQGDDFIGLECPPPMPVLILHGARDTHFPGYGRDIAGWWSSCNGCSGAGSPDTQGCMRYDGCAAETRYCETPRRHWRWAADPSTVVDFLARHEPE